MTEHKVAGREEWQQARDELLALESYKRRMGWRIPWVSAANTDFNVDYGASHTSEQVQGWTLSQDRLPPIVAVNAAATGTSIEGYLTESPAVSVFTRQNGTVYQTTPRSSRSSGRPAGIPAGNGRASR